MSLGGLLEVIKSNLSFAIVHAQKKRYYIEIESVYVVLYFAGYFYRMELKHLLNHSCMGCSLAVTYQYSYTSCLVVLPFAAVLYTR